MYVRLYALNNTSIKREDKNQQSNDPRRMARADVLRTLAG